MLISEAFALFIKEEVIQKDGADKTRRNYETALHSLQAAIGDLPVTFVTLDHVSLWQSYMQSLGNQPNSIKGYLCKLRCVLKFLKKRQVNVLDYRDIELPRVLRKRRVILDYSEIQKMIDAGANDRDKAIIACLFATGCRISELLNLNRDDIKNDEAIVLGKGSKPRTVYFDSTAMEYLNTYLQARKDRLPPLFISGQYRRITVSRVEQILHVVSAYAGLEKNVTPHVFRHSTISDYIANGAPMHHVQRLAGHASIGTTIDIYTQVPDPVIRETARKYHSH